MTENLNIRLADNEPVRIESGKWYKVLRAGNLYSRKYSGVWDADLSHYRNEEKPGVIEVRPNFIEGIFNNFQADANETIPFIDIDHEAGVSCGPIEAMKIQDGALYIMPAWNEKGREKVGNKEYMYLSLSVNRHVNSQTGETAFPVAYTASLTNIPVDKDQEILELSETSGGATADKADENKSEVSKMKVSIDSLKGSFDDLIAMIKKAVGSDDTGTYSKIVGAMIDNLKTAIVPAETVPEAPEAEKVDATMPVIEAGKPEEKAPTGNTGITMSESEKLLLSENADLKNRMKRLEDQAAIQAETIRLSEFQKRYTGKKITPAQEKGYFSLFLRDEKTVSGILDAMPELKLSETMGSTADVMIGDVTAGNARQIWDKTVIELSDKEKISLPDAAERVKKENPGLHAMVYGKK